MAVYFVGVEGDASHVKIGKSNDVTRRLTELARRFPSLLGPDGQSKLVLLAEVEGYAHVESWLHEALRAEAVGEEWFHLRGDVHDVVAFARQHGARAVEQLCPDAIARDRAEAHVVPSTLLGPSVAVDVADALKREQDDADRAWVEEAEAIEREIYEYEQRVQELICRESLYEYFVASWHIHEPGGSLLENWHLRAMCHEIQSMLEGWLVARGKGTETQIARVDALWAAHGLERVPGEVLVQNWLGNLPPATLKSRILMVVAPSWMMLHDEKWSCLAISSVDDNVRRDSNAHRELVTSAWYRELFCIKWTIHGDVDAVGDWETTAGGGRKSRTMLGGFTGIHVDCILLDDPDDAHKVHNEGERKRIQGKWTDAIRNRLNDINVDLRMAIQQRVHLDDWSSAQLTKSRWSLLERKGWAQWCVPVRWGRQPADAPRITPFFTVDPRSMPEAPDGIEDADAVLHPARFSPEVIADEIRDRGTHGFAAQMDQNPEDLSGGMFPRSYWRFFTIEGDEVGAHKRPQGCVGTTVGGEPVPDVERLVLKRKANGAGGLDLEWLTLTVDCTFGSLTDAASQVGLLLMGGRGQRRFVFADRTKPMTFMQTVDTIVECIASLPPMRTCIIELKANGAAVVEALTNLLAEGELQQDGKRRPLRWSDGKIARIELVSVNPEGGKQSRAVAMLADQRAGLIFLLDGAPWLDKFVHEVSGFPNAKKDDRVDALSQLMHHYNESNSATKRARVMNTW